MASPRTTEGKDPKLNEILKRDEGAWVPMFLARAALGLSSVVVVSEGGVALVSAVEASALLRKREDTRGSAKVSGTASPGAAWAVFLGASEHSVVSLAMTPILTRSAAP